jgi:adenylate cyclase
VLEPDAAPDGLKDAIVFVGTSAQGLRDLRLSPLGVMPGVEAHAQLIEQVMTGSFLDRPDPAWGLELTGLVLAALVVVAIVAWLGPGVAAAATAILVAAALGGAWYAFHAHRMLLEPLGPAAALGAVFLAASLVQYVRSARQERWIRQAFSSYISPNLVEHLIDHPERLRLGGERRDCSFVLTDLAGFTAVVERSDPEALVGLMNEYLDGMVGIAFRHEGTLDRIVGDAVAVMFSAPLEQPDHAQRAIACALEMDAFARGFRRAKNEEGVPLGRTRIGVHSGSVIVGNFGGQHAFDYRALGDAINTTARLETVNRHLGTRICVSAAAVERCPGFIGRPVGRLVLKGKSEPILAYEPLSADAAASPRIAEYLTAYGLLEAGDPDAAQAFDALAAHYPDDRLALFHRDRLARGERGAEIVMEAK